MNIHLDISEELFQKYNLSEPSQVEHVIRLGLQQIKIEEVLMMYRKGIVSLWKAATMTGITLQEMIAQASARGYEPPADNEMVTEDLT